MPRDNLQVGPCRPRELPHLRELLNEVFVEELGADGDIFEYAPLLYSEENAQNLRVVRRGRRLVGHAGILPREIRWRDQRLRVGLIGGVCCRKELRGGGIGTLAMEDAARRMAELDLHFGVLWTASPGFYQRLGWRHAGGITMMRIAEAAGESPVQREIMRLNESAFGPDCCHRLHEAAGRNEVIRTPDETRILLTTHRRDALLALEGGRPDGYAAHDGHTLREIEGDAECCMAVISRAAAEGCRLCVFPLHDWRVEAIAEAMPVGVEHRSLGMLLIVNREGLVETIARELGATPEELGLGPEESDEVLMMRIFGQPEREPSEEPLPLDIHIGYLDHV
ncbi:MAG: GNAT family N-acetyltransferase [Armatimonadota bacterium]